MLMAEIQNRNLSKIRNGAMYRYDLFNYPDFTKEVQTLRLNHVDITIGCLHNLL